MRTIAIRAARAPLLCRCAQFRARTLAASPLAAMGAARKLLSRFSGGRALLLKYNSAIFPSDTGHIDLADLQASLTFERITPDGSGEYAALQLC